MTAYDTVQYVMPTLSGVDFRIAPEDKNTSVTVLDGDGIIRYSNTQNTPLTRSLPLRHEMKFSSLPYTLPNYDINCIDTGHSIMAMRTKTKLAVRGNHYVLKAVKRSERSNISVLLFSVQMRVDSFLFIIHRQSVPLQIFTGDESTSVVIRTIHGSLGVMGSPLSTNKKYSLLPYSCVTVNSLTDQQCTVEVEGRNRMLKIALLLENKFLNVAKGIFQDLYHLCISCMKEKCLGPVVLIIGPPNVGKTSLCHFIINKAVDKGMNPLYIDLDVCKNSNSLPGSISLSEIKSHRHLTEGFKKHEEIILHFGNLNVNSHNVQFYHYLIRKLGQQMMTFLKNNLTSYSGAIIDMCGPLGQHTSTISCVSESFQISHVLVVGEQNEYFYCNINSLSGKLMKIVPLPEDIEPINHIFEKKSRDVIFRKYFYGAAIKPEDPDIIEIKLSDIKIYRVVSNSKEDSSTFNSTIYNDNDFSLQPVICGPFIVYYVLGVSKAADITEFSSAIEIDHYVCFTKIDLDEDLGLLLSPKPGPFSGKCLIMGNVKMTAD